MTISPDEHTLVVEAQGQDAAATKIIVVPVPSATPAATPEVEPTAAPASSSPETAPASPSPIPSSATSGGHRDRVRRDRGR
jgi:hypothetical protein